MYGSCRASWDLAPGSDRTAGDSSPVTKRTAGSGDARGRPAGQVPAQGWVKRLRRPRPSSTMPRKPPSPSADNCIRTASMYCQRSRPFARPLCAGAPTGSTAGGKDAAHTRMESKRRNPPAPLPGTGAALTSVLTKEGPHGSVPWGPSPGWTQTRDTVPQPSPRSGSRFRLRSYGSVVGPVGAAPVGSADEKSGCR
jgi:hypothetical protein